MGKCPNLPDGHFLKDHWNCEPDEWVPVKVSTYLSRYIITVAATRVEGTWKAYIKDVNRWVNSKDAETSAYSYGTSLTPKVALAIFPQFAGVPYAK